MRQAYKSQKIPSSQNPQLAPEAPWGNGRKKERKVYSQLNAASYGQPPLPMGEMNKEKFK